MAGRMWSGFTRAKEALLEHAYLITLGAVVAVIAGSAMYTSHVRTQSEMQVQAAAGAPELAETAAPQASALPEITPLPTIAPLTLRPMQLSLGVGTVWPVSGEVTRAHSPDEPVLWEAIGCYQAHEGVDIAGEAGEAVLCIMDGVVQQVGRDDLWGWRVRVEQTDGSTAVYAGLAVCALTAGQSVTRGQELGPLLEAIPAEAEQGAHLHLELERDGGLIDPQTLLQSINR